jgi:hypothetical protein
MLLVWEPLIDVSPAQAGIQKCLTSLGSRPELALDSIMSGNDNTGTGQGFLSAARP